MAFSFRASGEVITCNCLFDFWFYFINCPENRGKSFSARIKYVSLDSIFDFFGYPPPAFTIKVIDPWSDDIDYNDGLQSDEPCAVFSYCQSCYNNVIMQVASMNKMSFEEAKEETCKNPHELYVYNSKNKKCSYCLLNGCFAKIASYVFTTLDDHCVLSNLGKKISSNDF